MILNLCYKERHLKCLAVDGIIRKQPLILIQKLFHHILLCLIQFYSILFSYISTRPGHKFGSKYLLHGHPCSVSGTTRLGTSASLKPGHSLKK